MLNTWWARAPAISFGCVSSETFLQHCKQSSRQLGFDAVSLSSGPAVRRVPAGPAWSEECRMVHRLPRNGTRTRRAGAAGREQGARGAETGRHRVRRYWDLPQALGSGSAPYCAGGAREASERSGEMPQCCVVHKLGADGERLAGTPAARSSSPRRDRRSRPPHAAPLEREPPCQQEDEHSARTSVATREACKEKGYHTPRRGSGQKPPPQTQPEPEPSAKALVGARAAARGQFAG